MRLEARLLMVIHRLERASMLLHPAPSLAIVEMREKDIIIGVYHLRRLFLSASSVSRKATPPCLFEIAACKAPKFKAGKALKDAVNK